MSDITLFNDLLRLLLPAGMTSKIIRGAKITLPDSIKTEAIAPTATAYKMLTGKSLGVFDGKNISDSVGVIGTIGTGDNKTTIEGLGANPGFIIHNLIPRVDIFTQAPIAEVQVDQANLNGSDDTV